MTVTWHFCPDCSALLFYNTRGMMGVNSRCFDDFAAVDLSKITINKTDGATRMPGDSSKNNQ